MKRLSVSDLIPGMITATDVYTYNGRLIFPKGSTLTDPIITRLEFYSILSVQVEEDVGVTEVAHPVTAENELTFSQRLKRNPRFKVLNNQYAVQTNALENTIDGLVNGT